MMLSESDQIIYYETTTANAANITNKLKLKPTETETNEFTLSDIMDRYNGHQSIVKIQSQMNDEKKFFFFKPVMSEEVLKLFTL